MKKMYPLFFVLVIVSTISLHAQKQAERWFFGLNAGLNFNSGSPVAVEGALSTAEGCSSIADANGNTLFYTDGITVYDRRDSTMPNSGDLMGDISSTQSALIVPQPGNSNIYYIFTTAADGNPNGFRYSIVDLSLHGGYGDVSVKNVLVKSRSTEKVSAVSIRDGSGYWVMMHEWGSNGFYAYKLTAFGFDTTAVVSNVGTVHSDSAGIFQNCYGQLKFSHDGKKVVANIYHQALTELFDFNDSSGIVSNPITIPVDDRPYGAEFSGDNSKLYISSYSTSFDMYYLWQFDLSSGNRDTIIASQLNLSNADVMRALQIGPDKKIYVAQAYHGSLGVINAPDSLGTAADFQPDVITLSGITQCGLGLPGFVQSIFREKARAAFTTGSTSICPGSCVNFTDLSLNQPTSWQWHFSGATPDTSSAQNPQNICYPAAGFYSVTLIVGNGTGSFDTTTVTNYVQVRLRPSISISVTGDTMRAYNAVGYQWYKNDSILASDTNALYVATGPGSYTVVVTDSFGCSATSSPIIINATAIEDLNENAVVKIYPVPAHEQINVQLPLVNFVKSVNLKNVLGQDVSDKTHISVKNNLVHIDMQELPRGFYVVQCSTADKIYSGCFIKN